MSDPVINGLNLFADANNSALYQFNKDYANYVAQCVTKDGDSTTCSGLLQNINNYVTDYNNNVIIPVKTAISGNPSINSLPGSLTTNNQHDNIMQHYDTVTKKRTDLDAKLRELYDIPGSKSLDYKYNYDSTVYSGILLTIVASGIIYYTFTKL